MDTGHISSGTRFGRQTSDADDLDVLRLIRSRRVGPTTFHRLLAEHGNVRQALLALPIWPRQPGSRITSPAQRGWPPPSWRRVARPVPD